MTALYLIGRIKGAAEFARSEPASFSCALLTNLWKNSHSGESSTSFGTTGSHGFALTLDGTRRAPGRNATWQTLRLPGKEERGICGLR
jgi:hypothetical protein